MQWYQAYIIVRYHTITWDSDTLNNMHGIPLHVCGCVCVCVCVCVHVCVYMHACGHAHLCMHTSMWDNVTSQPCTIQRFEATQCSVMLMIQGSSTSYFIIATDSKFKYTCIIDTTKAKGGLAYYDNFSKWEDVLTTLVGKLFWGYIKSLWYCL